MTRPNSVIKVSDILTLMTVAVSLETQTLSYSVMTVSNSDIAGSRLLVCCLQVGGIVLEGCWYTRPLFLTSLSIAKSELERAKASPSELERDNKIHIK